MLLSLLSRAWRLNCGHACAFERAHVNEAVSVEKSPAGKGVVGLLSWHGSHFWVCIKFCKVRQGDSVTKPYYIIIIICFFLAISAHFSFGDARADIVTNDLYMPYDLDTGWNSNEIPDEIADEILYYIRWNIIEMDEIL